MRLELQYAGITHYVILDKERWSRNDLKRWGELLLDEEKFAEWMQKHVTELSITDMDGHTIADVADLTPDFLDNCDSATITFIYNLALNAYHQAAQLGNVTGGLSSSA